MKKQLFFIILFTFLLTQSLFAQVAINDDGSDANPHAALDISSTDKGILIPRVSTAQKNNMANTLTVNEDGLMVYDVTLKSFWVWNGTDLQWKRFSGGVEKIDDLTDGKSDSDGSDDGSSVFLGVDAGQNDDASDNMNVGVGYQTLRSNTTGHYNEAIGYQALFANTSGSKNVAIGLDAMHFSTTASDNIAIGHRSGRNISTSYGNIAIGTEALLTNTTGYFNVAIGDQALSANLTGTTNVAIGESALTNNTASHNTAVGSSSLSTNSSGQLNAAFGKNTLAHNTTASYNTAYGASAMETHQTGNNNTAAGYHALYGNVSGQNNTALGRSAGTGATGSGNVFLGYNAGVNGAYNNRLYIDNSNADESNALIYGEFDNNILRTNAEFQIGNPTGTGYTFPTARGTANQVLQTDGSGNLSWADVASSGNTLDEAYDEGGSGAGKDITADAGAVRVDGTDGFLVTGTQGSGNTIDTEITGAGTRMFFNPNKAAFRAGYVSGSQWGNTSIGLYSVAMGSSTIASGDYSTAMGNGTQASGNFTIAMGNGTTAGGENSTAMGTDTDASGYAATAMGESTEASGDNSTAMGSGTKAIGSNSTAMGLGTKAQGNYCTAMGVNTEADGVYSFSMGNSTYAFGDNSTAMGNNTVAFSYSETTIGSYNTHYNPAGGTTNWDASDRLFVIGNGQNSSSKHNALTIYKNGSMNINDAYTMPVADGTGGQVMQTDGSGNLSWVTPASSTDADFYEEGTTTPPDAITDDIYTQGNVAIGKTTADYPLDISIVHDRGINITYNATDNNIKEALTIVTPNAGNGMQQAIVTNVFGSGSGSHYGLKNIISNGTGEQYGVANLMGGASSSANYGVYTKYTQGGSGLKDGVRNEFYDTGTGHHVGVDSYFTNTTSNQIGVRNFSQHSGNYPIYGLANIIAGTNSGDGNHYGVQNLFQGTGGGILYGIYNDMSNSGSGNHYGTYTIIDGTGSGVHYGNYVRLQSTGTGIKYGEYIHIYSTAGGMHYGIYSNVVGASHYAGYFIGNLAVGTSSANIYTFPASRGANGQIMQTDGSGNLSWVTPTTGAQEINDLSDGKSDGSSVYLGDNAGNADTGGGNNNVGVGVDALLQDVDGDGCVAVGNSALRFVTDGYQNTAVGSGAGRNTNHGDQNVYLGNQSGYNNVSGDGNVFLGFMAGYNETGSNKLYVDNSNANESNALIYGEFDNNILRTNGEFQIGDPTGTGYKFPTARGTANQILKTDGSGNLSWVTPTTFADADFYEEGTTTPPDAITDDIYTQGNVAIGKTTADYPLDIETIIPVALNINVHGWSGGGSPKTGIYVTNADSNSYYHYGIINKLTGPGTGIQYASYQLIDNSGEGVHIGNYNRLEGSGGGIQYGTYAEINNSGNAAHYGSYSLLTGTGTGNKYGYYANISDNANGGHYGIYCEVPGTTGNEYAAVFNSGKFVANEVGGDYDFRVESDNNQNILFVDASTDMVGIGTGTPDKLLTVNGDARVTGDIYYGTGTNTYNKPDFVFNPKYEKDFDIPEVEKFISENGHLPWVTAANEEKEGVNMTRMSFETLETVENQQLQIISLKKENEAQKQKIKEQEERLSSLEERLRKLERMLDK